MFLTLLLIHTQIFLLHIQIFLLHIQIFLFTKMGSDTDKVAADIPLEYVPAEEYTRVFGSHLGVKQGLGKFYSPEALEKIVVEAKEMGDELMKQGCSGEYAVPLSLLKLYDIVMLVGWLSSHLVFMSVTVLNILKTTAPP